MAKYLKADAGGGTLDPLADADPQASTLSNDALQG